MKALRLAHWDALIKQISLRLAQIFIGGAVLTLAGSVMTALINVIARYVFKSGFVWAEELTIYLMIWTVFLAASAGLSRGEHIGVDFLTRKLEGRLKFLVTISCLLLVLGFNLVLAINGLRLAIFAGQTHLSPALQISMFWPRFAVPFGALILAIQSALVLISNVISWYMVQDPPVEQGSSEI